MNEDTGQCISECEPVTGFQRSAGSDDTGLVASRLAKKLLEWRPAGTDRLETIRPGTFTTQYIRSTGLKDPVLIKGDRFNENPQLGLIWPDVHNVSVDILAGYIGSSAGGKPALVDTWDVIKQRPGPAWTLAQWCTYWHARQDASTRMARPQTAHNGRPDEDDDDDGEVVDSGRVMVLNTGGATHSKFTPAPACMGISPEQAQRLLDGECLLLLGTQLTQYVHPPPAIQNVDLVRLVRPSAREEDKREQQQQQLPGQAQQQGVQQAQQQKEGSDRPAAAAQVLPITPAETLHLQMTPKDCFTDFRLAPSGAATWLYVLHGVKVLALLPPTAHNRRLFLTWAAATRANHPKENVVVDMFLAEYAENAVKVEVKASQALVIPAGWFYASTTLSDTLAVGCFFWHPYALADYARSQQLEMQLRLKSARFCLQARPLLWYAAAYFASFIRPKVGLPEFKLRPAKPTGSVGAHGGRSVSEASMSQRPSPHIRGQQAPVLMGSSSKQQQRTPPLLTNSSQDAGSYPAATLSSPAVRPRARQDAMDALSLGEAAVPLLMSAQHTPGAATVAAARQSVSSERHGAGGGTKRRRLTAGPPSRASSPGPGDGQTAAGHAASVSTVGTPRSISRGGFIAAATAQRQRQQSMSGTALVKHEQQQQATAPGQGYGRAAAEDDDDGECHTSPVRKPEVNLDGQAADDVDWGLGYVAGCYPQQRLQDRLVTENGVIRGSGVQQPMLASGSWAAAAGGGEQMMPKHITGLKIKVPGKSMPLYSPVIQGIKGDLDSIPPLCGIQQQQQQQAVNAAVTPPAAAGKQQVQDRPLLPAGQAPAAAGTPRSSLKGKIRLKGKALPSTPAGEPAAAAASAAVMPMAGAVPGPKASVPPAGAAGGTYHVRDDVSTAATMVPVQQQQQRNSRGSPDSSAGSHAVNCSAAVQTAPAPAGKVPQQRKMVLEPTSDEGSDEQQQQQEEGLGGRLQKTAVVTPDLQQRGLHNSSAAAAGGLQSSLVAQRRISDSGLPAGPGQAVPAAAAAAKAPGIPGIKLKFKLASPSPKLMAAPAAGAGNPPVLLLEQPVMPPRQLQQQQQLPAIAVPQVDGAADQHQRQPAQLQQQQQRAYQQHLLWDRWQRVQSSLQRSRTRAMQQEPLPGGLQWRACQHDLCSAACVLQVDGAGDEQRPRSSGPTLVLQPLLAPVAVQGGLQQQQQQEEHHRTQTSTQGAAAGSSLGLVAGASRAADAVAGGDSGLAAGRALIMQQNPVLLQAGIAAGLAGARDTHSPSKQLLQLRAWGASSTAKPPKQQGPALQQQQQQAGALASAPQLAPAVRGDQLPQQLQPESQDMLSPFLGGVNSLPPSAAAAAFPAGGNDFAAASKPAADAAAADSCEQPLMQPGKDASLAEEELRSDPSLIHWSRPAAASATLAGQCQGPSVSQSLAPQPLPAAAAIAELPDVPGNFTALAPVEAPEGMAGLDAPGGRGPSLEGVAAAAAGEAAGQQLVAADLTRQRSGMGDSFTPAATTSPLPAAFLQLPAAAAAAAAAAARAGTPGQHSTDMRPPPPARLSAWEVAELPVMLEFLQEQVAEKSVCEGPPNMAPDPEWLIQQLSEAVAEAVRKDREQQQQQQGIAAGVGGAVQQQPAMGTVGQPGAVTAAAAAAAVANCGPLVVSPFAPDEMPAGLADAIRVGQQLLRETGTAVALGVHDATTEVVGETDPLGNSVGAAGSLDNRSGGSYGTAAMARGGGLGGGAAAAAAAGGGGAASNRKRPAPAGSAQAASAATRGAQQLKKQKQDKLLKGLGIARR